MVWCDTGLGGISVCSHSCDLNLMQALVVRSRCHNHKQWSFGAPIRRLRESWPELPFGYVAIMEQDVFYGRDA